MLKHVFYFFASSFMFFGNIPIILADGKCEFFAKASVGVLEFTGKGCTVKGVPTIRGGKVSGEFVVDMTKLDSGIDLRTEHMRDKFLEVGKFPKATLKLISMLESGGKFEGSLNLHGVDKAISGTAEKTPSGYDFKFDVKTTDFGLIKAGYKGIEIGENISISGSIAR